MGEFVHVSLSRVILNSPHVSSTVAFVTFRINSGFPIESSSWITLHSSINLSCWNIFNKGHKFICFKITKWVNLFMFNSYLYSPHVICVVCPYWYNSATDITHSRLHCRHLKSIPYIQIFNLLLLLGLAHHVIFWSSWLSTWPFSWPSITRRTSSLGCSWPLMSTSVGFFLSSCLWK